MNTSLMDEQWQVLASLLPEGWRELARETGAMKRSRGAVTGPDVLLQLLLLHVATGLSLKQTAVRAKLRGLGNLSDVALLKRLRSSGEWLHELAYRMGSTSRFSALDVRVPGKRRLRAIDATTIEEPGATGTDWRVHFSISLPDLRCDHFELTDTRGGETYKRIPVVPGDIILGDRGYCHRDGVAHVVQNGGDVIVRLNSTSFPLLRAGNEPFLLLPQLRTLTVGEPGEWPVLFQARDRLWKARLCAIRRSQEASQRAKAKALRAATKNGKTPRPETLELAEYVFVLTTLEQDFVGTREILELYRARWQIELCFKRLKSLLHLGHLPKHNDASARAWIHGKLLTVFLIERLIDTSLISPWGFEFVATQPLAGVHRSS